MLRRDRRPADPLRLGDPVHIGDTIEVAASAKLKLRMNDGSVIAVASGSRLTIADYRVDSGGASRDATLSLGEGLLRAVVPALQGAAAFRSRHGDRGRGRALDRLVHRSSARFDASRRARRPRQFEERRHGTGNRHPGALGRPRRSRPRPGPGKGVDRGRIRRFHPPYQFGIGRAAVTLAARRAFGRPGADQRRSRDAGVRRCLPTIR